MYSIFYSGGLSRAYTLDKAEMLGTELRCPPASWDQGWNVNCIVHHHKNYCFGKSSARMQDFLFVHVDKQQDSGES